MKLWYYCQEILVEEFVVTTQRIIEKCNRLIVYSVMDLSLDRENLQLTSTQSQAISALTTSTSGSSELWLPLLRPAGYSRSA